MLKRALRVAVCAGALFLSTGTGLALDDSLVAIPSPKVTGTPAVGQALACDGGAWYRWNGFTTVRVTPTFAFQWLLNGSAIAGANVPAYAPIRTDAGRMVACQVTATLVTSTTGSTTTLTAVATSNAVLVPAKVTPPKKTGCARFTGTKRALCVKKQKCLKITKPAARKRCLAKLRPRPPIRR